MAGPNQVVTVPPVNVSAPDVEIDPVTIEAAPTPQGTSPQSSMVYLQGQAPVPEDQVAQALADRSASWMPGTVVSMIYEDGTRADVPAEEAWQAIDQGWRPELSDEKRQNDFKAAQEKAPVWSAIAAGASAFTDVADPIGQFAGLGAVRNLVLPHAVKAVTGKDITSKQVVEDFDAIQENNPVATTIGTVGGALMPTGIEGVVAGGLAKLAKPLTSLERIGYSAATHGASGALQIGAADASKVISRAALDDDPLTIERMLSVAGDAAKAGGEGAAHGFIIGSLLGGLGRAAGDKITSSIEKGGFLSPEVRALKAIGITDGQYRKLIGKGELSPVEMEKIGANLQGGVPQLEYILKQIRGPVGGRASSLANELLDMGLKGDIKTMHETIQLAKVNAGEGIGRTFEKLDAIGLSPNVKTQMILDMQDYLKTLNKFESDIKLKNYLERQFMKPLAESKTFSDLQEIKVRLEKMAWKTDAINTVSKETVLPFERKFTDSLETAVKNTNETVFNDYLKFKDQYAKMTAAETISFASMTKDVVGKQSFLSGYGGFGVGGAFGATAHFAGLGFAPALGVGIAGKLLWNAVKSDRAQMAIARGLNAVKSGTDTVGLKVGNSMKSVLGKDSVQAIPKNVPAGLQKVINSYQERSRAITEAKANPNAALARIDSAVRPMAMADPRMAAKTAQVLHGDVNYLVSKLPKVYEAGRAEVPKKKGPGRPKKGSRDQISTPPRVSPSDAASFVRTEMALSNPIAELEKMKDGYINPELAEVLLERRPAIREQIITETLMELASMAQSGRQPSYSSRIQASIVTGVPLDSSMEPEFIASVQTVWSQVNAPPEASQAPGASSPSTHRQRQRAQSEKTFSESLEDETV